MPRFQKLRNVFSKVKQKSNKSANNVNNEDTITPRRAELLNNAPHQGDTGAAQHILGRRGADPKSSGSLRASFGNGQYEDTELLYMASRQGDITAVKHILRRHRVDQESSDSLRAASGNDHADVVLLLLQHGVDANIADLQGNSALHRAVRNGHGKIARLLLEYGADPFMGLPSPLELAELMWKENAFSVFREMVREYYPEKLTGQRASEQMAASQYEQNEGKGLSRAATSKGPWPDRDFIYKGERVTISPSDPAYWN